MTLMWKDRLGELDVRLLRTSEAEKGLIIILLHGYGAPGQDLVPLATGLDVPKGTLFILPSGPIHIPLGTVDGRAWWNYDMVQHRQDILDRQWEKLTEAVPPGLRKARESLDLLIQESMRRFGASPERMVLGGFSQGSVLACDVVLHSTVSFAGLVLLSGMLIAKREWEPLVPHRKNLRVFQCHGLNDPLLPLALARQLRDLLTHGGALVQWWEFPGGHEIPQLVISPLGKFFHALVPPLAYPL